MIVANKEVNLAYTRYLIDYSFDCDMEDYNLLFRDLTNTLFKVVNSYDDNRRAEACEMRNEFLRTNGYRVTDLNSDVNVLELLVSMSMICCDLTFDSQAERTVQEWFYELIDNLGLIKFSDDNYHDEGGGDAVKVILQRWMNRRYKRNGEGGLFPLKYTKKDQKRVELWYQMHDYLAENYIN